MIVPSSGRVVSVNVNPVQILHAKLFVDLLQYGLPKLQALSHELGFERLSDNELNEIITTLINKSNEGE